MRSCRSRSSHSLPNSTSSGSTGCLSSPTSRATPLWLYTVLLKVALVDTCTAYDAGVPPLPADQFSVGVTGSLAAPVDGLDRVGAPGAVIIVVKLQTLDHALVLFAFVAFTSQ